MAWNREYARLTAKQDSGLSQMLGHMTVSYAPDGSGLVMMEPYSIVSGTNVYAIRGFTNAATIKVIESTSDAVVLKTTTGHVTNHVTTVHFDGTNSYWLRLPEDDPDSSVREYFTRE